MENYMYLNDTCEYSIRAEDVSFSVLVNKIQREINSIENNPEMSDTISKIMHTHAYTELFICINGSALINTSFGNIYLHSGDLLLVPAGVQHIKIPDSSEWASIGFTYFKSKKIKQRGLYYRLEQLCLREQPQLIRNQLELCLEIHKLLCNASAYSAEVTALHMLDILLRINETNLCENTVLNPKYSTTDKDIDKDINRLSQLERIFELSFTQDIHPSEVASQLCISERQLNRIVRSRFGTTFHKVISERRINAAAQLLITTNFSAEDICIAVGFNSKSVFYTAFHRKYGMTPSEFRKKQKNMFGVS